MRISPKVIIYTVVLAMLLMAASVFVQRKAINAKPEITLYKATQDIDIGQAVTSKALEAVKVSITEYNKDYLSDTKSAVGKIVKEKIYKGEYVNVNRLTNKNDPDVFVSDNEKQFCIPTNYIDDPYGLTFRNGDVVDIIFTKTQTGGQQSTSTGDDSQVVLSHVIVKGAIDENGNYLSTYNKKLANAIVFQSTTDNILMVTSLQYQGKFRLAKYPDNQK